MNVQIFISDRQCIVAQRTRKSLQFRLEFSNSEEGLRKFGKFIDEAGVTGSSILTDFVEEDYHVESLPHLGWLDRRRFLAKRLNQLYKHTPFRNALIQEREVKSDRILFSALTNPNLLMPCIETLLQRHVAISGISSVAMLSERLLPRIRSSHFLLLSVQQGTGLRQSFFLNGKLRFSRLALIRPEDDRVAVVRAESEKIYKYLHTLSLLPEQGMLPVAILCGIQEKEGFDAALMESIAIHPVILDLSVVARKIGLDGEISDALPLFLSLLGKGINHYGREEHTHGYGLMQWRHAATALSIALISVGAVDAGIDLSRAVQFRNQANATASRSINAQRSYRPIEQHGSDSPQKMKELVFLVESVKSKFASPRELLGKVSRSLAPFADIRINRLSWRSFRSAESAKTSAGEIDAGLFEPGASRIAVAIEGDIHPFDGNYRSANETVERFCQGLEKSGMRIEKVKLPLDLSPSANLVGRHGQGRGEASFSVEASMKADS